MRTLEEQINSRIANERMSSFLSMAFAILATVLAIVGVYGVLVFLVAKRTREIGVRMALGARRLTVMRLVATEMLVVIASGLATGIAVVYAGASIIESQLFAVKAHDPLVFAAAAGVMLAVALAATLVPALRAARIDPMRALRCD